MRSLQFPLEAAFRLKAFTVLLHLAAVAALGWSRLPMAEIIALSLAVLGSLVFTWRRWSRETGQLYYREGQGWCVERDGAVIEPVEILGSTVVTPQLVCLHAIGSRGPLARILLAPQHDRDRFRHLRVCLRVSALAEGRGAGGPERRVIP